MDKQRLKEAFEAVAGLSNRNKAFACALRSYITLLLCPALCALAGWATGMYFLKVKPACKRDPVEEFRVLASHQPEAPSLSSAVYSSQGGDKFHLPGCRYLPADPKVELVWHESAQEAVRQGLKPCKVCLGGTQ